MPAALTTCCRVDELSSAPSSRDPADRLDGWKQIADYLGVGKTTAQRWERDEGLPIHRHSHAKKDSVFAYKSELDQWRASRGQAPAARDANRPPASAPSPYRASGFGLAVVMLAATLSGVILWTLFGSKDSLPAGQVLPRPLASGVEAEVSPSLSPDGSQVVYARLEKGGSVLFVKPVDGGIARPLEIAVRGGMSYAGYPAWSPRGDVIAFLIREGENLFGLFVVSAAGGAAQRLAQISGVGICWPRSGDRIAFADRAAPGEPLSIFSMPIGGGARRRLTTPPPASFGDTFCAFSPDERRLAIVRHMTRHEGNVHVVPLDAAGNTDEQLTDSINGIAGIAWSPDSRWIVAGASQGLWRMAPAAGRKPLLVAGFEGGAAYPAFSQPANRRDTRLVYQSHYRDVNVWRWTADAAPDSIRRITESTWWDDLPSLSPVGNALAFLSNQSGSTQIWVSERDGTNARQLTFGPGHLVLSPQWSPDGRQIAFSSAVGGNRDIYGVRADGTSPTRLTFDAADDGNPSWSRDGRWIYFRSDRQGQAQIWKMPASGGEAVRMTDGEGVQARESSDGKYLYFVRNIPTAGLWKVPAEGGPETLVIPGVRESYWGVTDRGVVYIPSEAGLPDGTFEIRFFDMAAGTSSVIVRPRASLMPLTPGFSVSPDGRSIYWTQVDDDRDDVMLIAPWHP